MTRAGVAALGVVAYAALGAYTFFFEFRPMAQAVEARAVQVSPKKLPWVNAGFQRGLFSLSGAVPDESLKSLLATSAQALFGPDRVAVQLEVDPELESVEWITRVTDLFPKMQSDRWLHAGLAVKDGKVILSGIVATVSDRAAFGSEATVALQGLTLDNQIESVPAESAEMAKARIGRELFGTKAKFTPRSAILPPATLPTLDAVAGILRNSPKPTFDVKVHGDDVELSARRAEAVRAYLIARGVAGERLHPASEPDTREWLELQVRLP